MEDFYYAGGLPVVMRNSADLLHRRRADRQRQDDRRECRARRLLQPRRDHAARREPFKPEGGIAVLRGNLVPGRRGDQAFRRDARN